MIKETKVIKNVNAKSFSKPVNNAEFDFLDIEKRLKELKELEKKLLKEIENFNL